MTHPLLLLTGLAAGVALLWKLSGQTAFAPIFRILPLPFWCYVLPMLATTAGWLPDHHPLYDFFSAQLLPVCLVLLLISTDLKSVIRLGPLATTLMLAGSAGTMIGGLVSFHLYRRWLPDQSWMGIGALSASWIGGSANLLAVKEALKMPNSLLGPLVIVDALIAYSWMALLVAASGWQSRWNERMVSATRGPASQRSSRPSVAVLSPALGSLSRFSMKRFKGSENPARSPRDGALPALPVAETSRLACGITLSVIVSLLAQWISQRLPAVGQVVNASTWTILLVTTASLLLSLTPLSKAGQAGASKVGTFLLYLLLTSIGARANFQAITQAPIFLALGLTWITIHGLCLLAAGYFLKAPLGLMAAASQANIGGPISAPIVAATYHPNLASVGLLMAILGNILGTYLGVFTAVLAHSF